MNRQSGFLFTMQFYQTCRIPDETKNILGPKINPPDFQALISPSPEIFPWRIKWYGTPKNEKSMFVVGLFMVPSAEFYFFSSDSLNCAASIVRVRYYTNQIVLNTLWNPYLKQATKNVSRYLYFPKFPIPEEIPWWKISKQKRNSFIISVTSTLPSPLQPPLWAGPRV